jgi:hypothetical protein
MNARRIAALFACLLLASRAALAFPVVIETHVMEFVNEITGHYVLLEGSEVTSVENGSAGPGWVWTGQDFYESDPNVTPGLAPVCRFYSPVFNSHFFTANAAECEGLKSNTDWVYEKIAFSVIPTTDGACPSGQQPIYRVYNNRVAQRDVNHRFTPDLATRDAMVAAGWVDEGIAWCADSGGVNPVKSYSITTPLIGDASQCEAHPGACVRVGQLPALTTNVPSFLPPNYVNLNPEYPIAANSITGAAYVDLHTAQPSSDSTGIAAHSFVQAYDTGSSIFGVHVIGTDRTTGMYASIDPMYELPGAAPAAGGTDERLFPWRGVRHHTIQAVFTLMVPTIARGDTSSHAYGNLILQFADTKSGHAFYATVQSYGTQPPADFIAPDAITGLPIVSTSFRATPAFGTRVGSDFKSCIAGSACLAAPTTYTFSMIDADMAKAVQMARTLDPALSTDPADYFVGQFRVHNETYGNAELGATVSQAALNLYY